MLVDSLSKRVAICDYSWGGCILINFKDIYECEIIENGNSVAKDSFGRAIVGGVLAGGVGAIVGAITHEKQTEIHGLYIRVITSNIKYPQHKVNFIEAGKTFKSDSPEYREVFGRAEYNAPRR